jgi:hypothetical protein
MEQRNIETQTTKSKEQIVSKFKANVINFCFFQEFSAKVPLHV